MECQTHISIQTAQGIFPNRRAVLSKLVSWFCIWEIFPILGIAAFLRFYQLTTTEFDADQAMVFRMARDAINHGLIPATSNIASIRIVNPPAVIHLLMIPAAFSSNPLWGAIFVGLLNVFAVLLTYIFVRRYYGRIEAIIASLLYATASEPLHYSRFIWQQNLIAPFVVLLFSTYLLWEFSIKFGDLKILLQTSKLHSHFDLTALNYYGLFLNPYGNIPTNTHTLEYKLVPLLEWLPPSMAILIISGLALITMGVISSPQLQKRDSGVDEEIRSSRHTVWSSLRTVNTLWTDFRAAPRRCGYFLLLTWQIVPIMILSHHSVPVFPYYLLMVLPGPFIIIGILLSTLADWFQWRWWVRNIARYGVYVCICLVIVAQLLGSTAALIDEANGNNLHGYSYNTLNSLEDALSEADQLARLHNLNHVYIATDQYTQTSLDYLAEQMHTPSTLFDASRCLVLPSATAGPAALLIGPYDTLSIALLSHFARATLVSHPERLGGVPFQLYIVQSIAASKLAPSHEAFVHHLQLLDRQVQQFRFDNSSWLATRWSYIRSATADYRTTYTYTMMALLDGKTAIASQCISTSIRAGDQLIVTFPLSQSTKTPSSMTIIAKSFTTMPLDLSYGSFHLENIRDQNTQPLFLQTTEGKPGISLSTS